MARRTREKNELPKRMRKIRLALVKQLRQNESELRAVREIMSRGSERGGDIPDQAVQTSWMGEMTEKGKAIQRSINENRAALARMNEGQYGLCIKCGEEIPLKRLQARPHSIECVPCVEEQEKGVLVFAQAR